jgi:hypothetical protein
MRNKRLREYNEAVAFVSARMDAFGIDEIKLVCEAKQMEQPPHPSDWSRVMRSSQAEGIISPTDTYAKSRTKKSNGVPRMVYKPTKPKKGGV